VGAANVVHENAADAARQSGIVQVPTPNFLDRTLTQNPSADLTAALRSRATGDSNSPDGAVARPTADLLGEADNLELTAPAVAGADLLNGSGAQPALDLGVQQFLNQLDDLGREVSRSLQETSGAVWILVAALGAVTFEVARRRRKARRLLGIVGGPDGLEESWVPGLSGPLGSEES
jgi:hypothetical protein